MTNESDPRQRKTRADSTTPESGVVHFRSTWPTIAGRGIIIGTEPMTRMPMPIHDWSRKPPGLFHHFHQRWAVSICDALNAGHLPQGFYALLDQRAAGVVPDDAPPKTRFTSQASDEDIYAAKADRIAIYHPMGDIVAITRSCRPGTRIVGTRSDRSWKKPSTSSVRVFMS